MKVAVFRDITKSGEDSLRLSFWDAEFVGINTGISDFVGFIDLPIEKPKKTVVKEAVRDGGVYSYEWFGERGMRKVLDSISFSVPHNAKNIKCTYEVEE